LASAELYNPATGRLTRTGDMTAARSGHTASALGTQDGAKNGDVLIVGSDGSADVYDPSIATFTSVGSFYPASGKCFQPHRESTQRWYRSGGRR